MWIKRRPKEWRPIPGFAAYEVSDVGHVRRLLPAAGGKGTWVGKVLKAYAEPDGYLRYSLSCDGKSQYIYEHTAVLLAFHGPKPSPLHECAHEDGNPDNNDYRNLRWATKKANYADAVRHGTAPTLEQLREWGRAGAAAMRAKARRSAGL